MRIKKPQRDGDVVGLTFVRDRDGPLDMEQIPLSSIIEHELIRLGS